MLSILRKSHRGRAYVPAFVRFCRFPALQQARVPDAVENESGYLTPLLFTQDGS